MLWFTVYLHAAIGIGCLIIGEWFPAMLCVQVVYYAWLVCESVDDTY